MSEAYTFDDFTLEVAERRLAKGAEDIALPPKAFELLVALIRNSERLMTKDELLALIWPHATVEEGILAVHVSTLRKALGDTSDSPAFIQTVARAGYRFIGAATRVAAASRPPRRKAGLAGTTTRRAEASIAVLPFLNLSTEPDSQYFSDGLTEEIITALARIPNLKVTARTSAFAFRGKEQDVRRIARALKVRTLLEGSVRRTDTRLRVTAQLIDAEDGFHVWSQRYDRDLTDIFAVQDDIASAIAGALELKLSSATNARPDPPSLPAYEAYLRALHHLRLMTAESIARACECFEQAIAIAPRYAAAHTGLAMCYVSLATESMRPAHTVMPSARAAAEQALALNPADRDAVAILGIVAIAYDYDARKVEAAWRALGERADTFNAVYFAGFYLSTRRGLAPEIDLLEHVLEIDPLNVLFRAILGNTYMWTEQYDRALGEAGKLLELDAPFYGAYGVIAQSYLALGRLGDALAAAEKGYKAAPWHPRVVGWFAAALALNGDHARAAALLREMRSDKPLGVPMGMVVYHLVTGEPEAALDWYEKAVEEREPLAVPYVADPLTRPLHANPRWTALLKTMNLPAARWTGGESNESSPQSE
jgi:TolB-like protein